MAIQRIESNSLFLSVMETNDFSSTVSTSRPAQRALGTEDLDTPMSDADDDGIDPAFSAPEHHENEQGHVSADDKEKDNDDNNDRDDDENDDDDDNDENDDDDDDDDDVDDEDEDKDFSRYAENQFSDPFGAEFTTSHRGSRLPVALSMLGGMLSMSGMGSRLREILGNLRRKDNISAQLIALQDLSEILLVSNEDNLIGSFSPDPYVRELVSLMQPNETTGEENPELMLLACRCLANMMEAIPASAANVVHGGAVPILCQKLLEISFIDLAEQALSTLEKISVEYPSRIVREGGLTACLSYLEFFATSTQRTAVTTAANCCRNIPEDSFSVVRDVMPILLNVLGSNDQRVVEQAALCVSRIVESFKYFPSKLEELVGVELLKAILRLLLPGSTNHLVGPNLHTQFLRVLAITADNSPRLAAELLKMNVVDTLYQNLTGVSPPTGIDDITAKLDSVLIMQALIHRPREQVIETLNVICNLLPSQDDSLPVDLPIGPIHRSGVAGQNRLCYSRKKHTWNEKRLEFLETCKEEVRRFTLILLPTLADAYSSTVNLDVRLRILTAQIKMLSNIDRDIVLEALREVPYASFLASILSQQDHTSLVGFALQATELLMSRFGEIYRYQLYREGVISQIEKLAATPEETESDVYDQLMALEQKGPDSHRIGHRSNSELTNVGGHEAPQNPDHLPESNELDGSRHDLEAAGNGDNGDTDGLSVDADSDMDIGDVHGSNDDDDARASVSPGSTNGDSIDIDRIDEEAGDEHESRGDDEDGDDAENYDEVPGSPASSDDSNASHDYSQRCRYAPDGLSQAQIGALARQLLGKHETEKTDMANRSKATRTLSSLKSVANEILAFYLNPRTTNAATDSGIVLFKRLADFFDSNVFESATSAELLGSGLVDVLERVFGNPDERLASAARLAFLECFIGYPIKSRTKAYTRDVSITPFSILVQKLQDLLSRSENFAVITVHHNTFDGNHTSAASMLAKQIRLRLVADDDSEVPHAFKSIMVSIHAIATFKTLEDYLRPRISLSDRSQSMRQDGLSRAIAAITGSNARSLSTATAARLAARGSHLLPGSPLLPDTPNDDNVSLPSGSRQNEVLPQAPLTAEPPSHREPDKSKAAIFSQVNTKMALSAGTESDAEEKVRDVSRRPYGHHIDSSNDNKFTLEEAQYTLQNDGKNRVDFKDGLDLSHSDTMDTVVGNVEENMTSDDALEALAMTMDTMGSGRKSASKEDNSRVPTFSQQKASSNASRGNASTLAAALREASPTPSRPNLPHPTSFDFIMQQSSQDWHMEFTLEGRTVPMDVTVYRAVLNSIDGNHDQLGRSVWSTVHTIHYRRVRGPRPSEPAKYVVSSETHNESDNARPSEAAGLDYLNGLDGGASLNLSKKAPITSSILRLLKYLHDFNANIDDIFVAKKEAPELNAESLLQFVNTKLTAKLNRQLEEPLIVASNCLPSWSEDLARLYPFLFPFETRHLFLQSTSFGYARSMARWQNAQVQDASRRDRRDERPFLGRLQRQKVRISRSKILESAVKVMELYGASQSILEVEYFEEVGTGLGPTLEFYSTVSREFSKKKLRLWRDNEVGDSEFVSGPTGLFPRPLSEADATGTNGERLMSLFRALGKFVARSMLDSRIIDIHFNPTFFRIGDGSSGVRPSLGAVKAVDPALARSLLFIQEFATSKEAIEEDVGRNAVEKAAAISAITINNTQIEDLSLDFTLPGYPEIELIPGGCQKSVTIDNVGTYVEKVVSMTLEEGVRRQVEAFRRGFSQVFPYSALSAFTPDELVSLFGRVEEDWSLESRSLFYRSKMYVSFTLLIIPFFKKFSTYGLHQGRPWL